MSREVIKVTVKTQKKQFLAKLQELKVIRIKAIHEKHWDIQLDTNVRNIKHPENPESLKRSEIIHLQEKLKMYRGLIVLMSTVHGPLTLEETVKSRLGGRTLCYIHEESN